MLTVSLWVRSYRISNVLYINLFGSRAMAIDSLRGQFRAIVLPISEMPGQQNWWWLGYSELSATGRLIPASTKFGFGWLPTPVGRAAVFPHWFIALSSASLAAVPWMKWRFSLRTLLILTALIAGGLGFIVL